MKRSADAMKDWIRIFASTCVGELKDQIQEQLVCQLLVGHTTRKRGIHATTAAALIGWNDWAAFLASLIDFCERINLPNLLELGPQTLDLCSKLDLELGIFRLVMREVLPGLTESNKYKSVLDAAYEPCLVRHLPRLELLQVLEQNSRE